MWTISIPKLALSLFNLWNSLLRQMLSSLLSRNLKLSIIIRMLERAKERLGLLEQIDILTTTTFNWPTKTLCLFLRKCILSLLPLRCLRLLISCSLLKWKNLWTWKRISRRKSALTSFHNSIKWRRLSQWAYRSNCWVPSLMMSCPQ